MHCRACVLLRTDALPCVLLPMHGLYLCHCWRMALYEYCSPARCLVCCCWPLQEVFRDPVVAADGHSYERAAIVEWLSKSDVSPLTNAALPHKNLLPNNLLRQMVQDFAMW
jgi:U-box domain